jgi:hypothetical protein
MFQPARLIRRGFFVRGRMGGMWDTRLFIAAICASLPVTVVVGFAAFTIGRRQFSILALMWLIALFAVSIWLALTVPRWILDVSG